MRKGLFFLLWLLAKSSHAWTWQDLWATPDQQGEAWMQKGQYKKAAMHFKRSDWQATAYYRMGDYEKAAVLFEQLGGDEGFYNQGNALAHMGRYEEAIKAYDKALQMNPKHEDAQYNKRVLEALLAKQKTQSQDHQTQSNENKAQDPDKEGGENAQNNPSSSDAKAPDSNPKNAPQPSTPQEEAKTEAAKNDKPSSGQEGQTNPPINEQAPNPSQAKGAPDPAKEASERWLQLIPDEPGGLLAEKFLRDHLKRQRGW